MDKEDVIKKLQEGFDVIIGRKSADPAKIAKMCLCQADSLPESPVRIVEAAEQIGLEVYGARLPEGVSGMLNLSERKIYLEKSESKERQRFTCAHEIGHFILHEDELHGDVLLRSAATSALEREANTMAAEILMPRHFLKDFVSSNKPLHEIASIFKVSEIAATHRIKNVLDKSKAEKYWENNLQLTLGRPPIHNISVE